MSELSIAVSPLVACAAVRSHRVFGPQVIPHRGSEWLNFHGLGPDIIRLVLHLFEEFESPLVFDLAPRKLEWFHQYLYPHFGKRCHSEEK
ncbi:MULTISPECIES: hypothetical protein [Bradyrhizobium]|uniref:hypothetical protein n=1 Tax=Bradyrhizobium brasilense TaxID=1419277 RepID=UPI0013018BDD|nr:hypothetical protein [Bradyrhizobium brasilense]